MKLDDKIRKISKNWARARRRKNFRRIHKWEADFSNACYDRYRYAEWCSSKKQNRKRTLSLFKLRKNIIVGLKKFNLTINDFQWDWCPMCRCTYVKCPKCGNNSCNGTYGSLLTDGSRLEIGKRYQEDELITCDMCSLSHAIEQMARRTERDPKMSDIPNAQKIQDEFDQRLNDSFQWLDDLESGQL